MRIEPLQILFLDGTVPDLIRTDIGIYQFHKAHKTGVHYKQLRDEERTRPDDWAHLGGPWEPEPLPPAC